ncbi:hypothetical protein OAory_01014110 [Aspergillus oryzae]|uniref:Uncharacterized protein n=1 Tax=Aspergillus oryzae TaxID=5062 RepID=A0A1S9DX86_ASPOZ|nr:hypothetical protein OAory_01014110 [Aspergillus oryzae]
MVTRRKHKAQNLASRELRERHHQMANNLVDVGHNGSVDSNEPATELIEKTLDPSTRQALDYVLPKFKASPSREYGAPWVMPSPRNTSLMDSECGTSLWDGNGLIWRKAGACQDTPSVAFGDRYNDYICGSQPNVESTTGIKFPTSTTTSFNNMLNTEMRYVESSTIGMGIYTDGLSTHTSDWHPPENHTINDLTSNSSSVLSTMQSDHQFISLTAPEMTTGNVSTSLYSSMNETVGLAAYTTRWRDSEEQDPRTYIQCPFSHDLLSIRGCEWCGQPTSISEGHMPSQSYCCPPSISAANEYGEEPSPHFPISLALDTSAAFGIDTGFDHTIMAEGNQPSQGDQTPAEELALASSMIEPSYPNSTCFDGMDSGGWPVIPLAGSNGRNTASANTPVPTDQSTILGYGEGMMQNWVMGHYR